MNKVLLSVLLSISLQAFASDHIDGDITKCHGQADITDLYAFPTPGKSGWLTMVLNTYPMMPSGGHFEDRLQYMFRVRPAVVVGQSIKTLNDEQTIICQFKDAHDKARNTGECRTKNGLLIEGKLNTINQGRSANLWAGRRSDPFFFDADWSGSVSGAGKIPPVWKKTTFGFITEGLQVVGLNKSAPKKPSNVMDKINALSIVLEVQVADLFPSNPSSLLAIVGEVDVRNTPESELEQLDRVGRPEITNVSMVKHGEEKDLRDGYNVEESFNIDPANRSEYAERLRKNIAYYDNLDGSRQWDDIDTQAMAEILVDDYLVIDINKPCDGKSFLSIEKSVLAGEPYQTCGGRKLTEDIMDELYSLYINKATKIIGDGVDKPYRKVTQSIPYLAQPDDSLAAKAKASIARGKVAKCK